MAIWILASGFWTDSPNVWDDNAVWIDGPPVQPGIPANVGRGGSWDPQSWDDPHTSPREIPGHVRRGDEHDRKRIRARIARELGLELEDEPPRRSRPHTAADERRDELNLLLRLNLEENALVHEFIDLYEARERRRASDLRDVQDLDAKIDSLIELRSDIAEVSSSPHDARDLRDLDWQIEDYLSLRNQIARGL